MQALSKLDRYLGVMYGLAVGDALGAPVEFTARHEMFERWPHGITGFEPWRADGNDFRAGCYTDDTQMSIATARGGLAAVANSDFEDADDALVYVFEAYRTWALSQSDPQQSRFPGTTCMSILDSSSMGTIENAVNDRKGCGTTMRVAPCALLYPASSAFEWAARCGALTHGHRTGWLAGAMFADIIMRVMNGADLRDAIECALPRVREIEAQPSTHVTEPEVSDIVDKVLRLHDDGAEILPALDSVGDGWVAEEALGVALMCCLTYPDDYEQAVLAAVHINGDSDSTGSITGALSGALLGIQSIRPEWVDQVEDSAALGKLARDLYIAHEGLSLGGD